MKLMEIYTERIQSTVDHAELRAFIYPGKLKVRWESQFVSIMVF
jgi:hypothetical protein